MVFEEFLSHSLDGLQASVVKDAMNYSLMAGGKRIRPQLVLVTLKGYGLDPEIGYACAAALEMIHTYSLIHDDLPCMDNDDLRRGRPTCHKQFDEATAVLAGDGLLTQAFTMIAESGYSDHQKAVITGILALCAGSNGMILGQCLDIDAEKNKVDFEGLKRIHYYKTGQLLSAPMMMAAVLASKEDAVDTWAAIGKKIGLAFQVQDDIFDVTKTKEELGKSNSDLENDKSTSVVLLGLEKAQTLMDDLYNEAIDDCKNMKDFNAEEIVELILKVAKRSY